MGDSRIQVQREEDGGGGSGQNWIEIEWSVDYAPQGVTRHKSSKKVNQNHRLIIFPTFLHT